MAETDVMLVAIRMDAKGAIQDTEVLDRKFTSLGSTFQKGQKRAEGAAQAQKKLEKSIKGTSKSTVEANVANISKLAAMEAATSGLNQLISAQYKRIDADVASGKISMEEAEKERKKIKQHEKYTGILETVIAVERLRTVGLMMYAAASTITIAGIEAQTIAVLTLNGALAVNPVVALVEAGLALAAVIVYLGYKFNMLTDQVTWMNEQADKFMKSLTGVGDSVRDLLTIDISGSKLWSGIMGGD